MAINNGTEQTFSVSTQSPKKKISNVAVTLAALVSICALGVLLGGLGSYQGWWSSPFLNLSNQIIMMAVGSASFGIVLLISSIIILRNRGRNIPSNQLLQRNASHSSRSDANLSNNPIQNQNSQVPSISNRQSHSSNQPKRSDYLEKENQEFIKKIQSVPLQWNEVSRKLRDQFSGTSIGYIEPDWHVSSSLFLAFENNPNPEVYFSPASLYLNGVNSDNDTTKLTQILQAAFASGKKMVVVQLATHHPILGIDHAIAAGFNSDGSFKIIDSMFDGDRYAQELAKVLNRAQILDSSQRPIHFSGEYINTHLQKGGNSCLFFASLYCYHMAIKKDLGAFAEVNGAFLENRLQRFEDYKKISGAQKIRSLKGNYSYDQFISSWAHRSVSLEVDSWDQLSWHQFVDRMIQTSKGDDTLIMVPLKLTDFPDYYNQCFERTFVIESAGRKYAIENAGSLLEPRRILLSDLSIPIRNTILQKKSTYLLFIEKATAKVHLFQLAPGQKVYYCAKLSNGAIRETLVAG